MPRHAELAFKTQTLEPISDTMHTISAKIDQGNTKLKVFVLTCISFLYYDGGGL